MNESIEFKSLEELYNRVLPALYSKVKELRRLGYNYVTEKDVWNFLATTQWKKTTDLQLHNIISDILYANNTDLYNYVLEKMGKLNQTQNSIVEIHEDNIL